MLEVNPGWSSLSVGILLNSKSICLIMVEGVNVGLALGRACGRQTMMQFFGGAE